ncbi:hypothetical protein U1Q18_030168 [Sarracenia purpurea var. burkii]
MGLHLISSLQADSATAERLGEFAAVSDIGLCWKLLLLLLDPTILVFMILLLLRLDHCCCFRHWPLLEAAAVFWTSRIWFAQIAATSAGPHDLVADVSSGSSLHSAHVDPAAAL